MKYRIYHSRNTYDSLFYTEHGDVYNKAQALTAYQAGNYEYQATVEAPYVDSAYEISQNVEKSWLLDRDVSDVSVPRARSTSVGDILVDERGTIYIVASFGFTEIEQAA